MAEDEYTPSLDRLREAWFEHRTHPLDLDLDDTAGQEFDRAIEQVRADERERAALQAAIRSAPLFEHAWDEGNAMGLDGWTGPKRGSEPDQHAIERRERTVDQLADDLRTRIAREGGNR